jgi:hypothetical protein
MKRTKPDHLIEQITFGQNGIEAITRNQQILYDKLHAIEKLLKLIVKSIKTSMG